MSHILSLFSTPKPFQGHQGLIQSNALRSWVHGAHDVEVLLFGDEYELANAPADVPFVPLQNIERNPWGTPLISSMFERAEREASSDLLVFINADILVTNSFFDGILKVSRKLDSFLCVGRRTDLDITRTIDFERPDWEEEIRTRVAREGRLHGPSGLDYFAFRPGTFPEIPPFAVGRPGWDNWMVFSARKRGIPVVDATYDIQVVHQNHDYSHHKEGREGVWEGPEAKRNLERFGSEREKFTLRHATHIFRNGRILPAMDPVRLWSRFVSLPAFHEQLEEIWAPIDWLDRMGRRAARRFRGTF